MATSVVELRNIAGTEAALGWAGSHTVVVDRQSGVAGGIGLGFNGAQLLGLAIGGCYCNDLRYMAHAMDLPLDAIAVTVTIELEGSPLIATRADLTVACTLTDGSDAAELMTRAWDVCTVARSLMRGVAVHNLSVEGSKPGDG